MRGEAETETEHFPNSEVHRFVISHLLSAIAEWAALIGLLVFTLDEAGARAVGFASFTALSPYLLVSSTTARFAQVHPPARARLVALLAQVFGFGIAGLCALMSGPIVVVVGATALGFTGATANRPAGAVLLPALVRSSRQLTSTNVSVGRCDSASVLLGPLMATGLLALSGGGAVLVGCAALAGLAAGVAAFDVRGGPPAGRSDQPSDDLSDVSLVGWRVRLMRVLGTPLEGVLHLARRPGASGVLAAAAGQFFMIGAFDITLVVIASEHAELGKSGAGILSAFFGAGAFLSMTVAGFVASRARLAPLILALLVVMAVVCTFFGAAVGVVTAVIALPILGASRSLIDLMSRVLLQRSAPPSQLAEVFGALESVSGAGLLLGSLFAQILIGIWGTSAALIGVGGLFGALSVMLIRPLRTVDSRADVPVVVMSLLRRMPVFAPLPAMALEAVARSAEEVTVAAGEDVIRQGETGDRFYAVADGSFNVVRSGKLLGTAERGTGFGEVALLANVPRTATVTATRPGRLLAIGSAPFLLAVTGYEPTRQAARRILSDMAFDGDIQLIAPGESDPPAP